MTGPRRKPADELVQMVGNQLRGPLADQVRSKISAWADPRAKLDRRRRRTSRVLTLWLIILSVFAVLGVFGFTALGTGVAVVGSIGVTISGALALRSGQRLRELKAARQRLELTAGPPRPALPSRASVARQPMERLRDAEDTLHELLRQLDSSALTSMPAESVAQARATSAEASAAIRAVAAQLLAVERARDTAPPLERAPLVQGVRALREQLDDGVDGYCALVAAAGRALAASTASNPREILTDATDHLAGLASAMRDVSGYSAF